MTSTTQNSILDLPEETRAHIFGFLSTAELGLFGKTNTKTHEDTNAVTFLRTAHSATRLRPGLEALLKNWEHEKEHRTLESIVAKLGTLADDQVSFAFITSLDTSSLKNFNESMSWLDGDYTDDDEWINILFPNPRLGWNPIVWTSDERKLVDRWLSEFHEYWNNYFD